MTLSLFRLLRAKNRTRFLRETRAAALVEFAIVASLLLVLVFGMVDYGRYFLNRTNLTNAVRDGARYGAVLSRSTADSSAIVAYTIARISVGAPPANSVTKRSIVSGGVETVRVTITNYPFTPSTFLVIKTAKTITVSAEFRLETP